MVSFFWCHEQVTLKATKKIDEISQISFGINDRVILEGIFNPQKYETKLLTLFNLKYKLSPAPEKKLWAQLLPLVASDFWLAI